MKNSNKKGFTLVELVVVIAIIGVLAAILVPSMMGYVKKSRLKTANGNAKTAYNAIAEIDASMETQGTPIDWSKFTAIVDYDCKSDTTATSASAAADQIKHELYKALSTNGNEAGCATVFGATINSASTFVVQWRKTSTDDIFGQYPDAVKSLDDLTGKTVGSKV